MKNEKVGERGKRVIWVDGWMLILAFIYLLTKCRMDEKEEKYYLNIFFRTLEFILRKETTIHI